MSELPFDPPRGLPFKGETVVFTGKLWSFGRKDACAIVEELGGACDEDVTVRTTLLVVGAWNGARPVTIWYASTPIVNTSPRTLGGPPSSTSGGTYGSSRSLASWPRSSCSRMVASTS